MDRSYKQAISKIALRFNWEVIPLYQTLQRTRRKGTDQGTDAQIDHLVELQRKVIVMEQALSTILLPVEERKTSCGLWAERVRKIARTALEKSNG
jgi:hypothetical protein